MRIDEQIDEEPSHLYDTWTKEIGTHTVRGGYPNPKARPNSPGCYSTSIFRCVKCGHTWPYGSEKWATRTPCDPNIWPKDYL